MAPKRKSSRARLKRPKVNAVDPSAHRPGTSEGRIQGSQKLPDNWAEKVPNPGWAAKSNDDAAVAASIAAEDDTEAYKAAMWKGQSNIMVAVRVRPLWEREKKNSKSVMKVWCILIPSIIDFVGWFLGYGPENGYLY